MPLLQTSNLSISEQEFKRISNVIYKHCGINLHEGKKSLVRARLAKQLRESPYTSYKEYIDHALRDGNSEEFQRLVDSLSTNLTSFFRERIHLDYLKETYLPQLIEAQKGVSRPKLRIWSAGCSSGEEAYTLGITVLESIADVAKWDVKILASDVSTRMLEKAQVGSYSADRIAPLTPPQRQRFLTAQKVDGKKVYLVHSALRNLISFRYVNLMEPWPFRGTFDVIFCRNVMIYFDRPTQTRLVNRFWEHLNKGGLLCIGHSESLTSIDHKYDYIQPATYRK